MLVVVLLALTARLGFASAPLSPRRSARGRVHAGDTEQDVVNALGEPQGRMSTDDLIVLAYRQGTVDIVNGRVASFDLSARVERPRTKTPTSTPDTEQPSWWARLMSWPRGTGSLDDKPKPADAAARRKCANGSSACSPSRPYHASTCNDVAATRQTTVVRDGGCKRRNDATQGGGGISRREALTRTTSRRTGGSSRGALRNHGYRYGQSGNGGNGWRGPHRSRSDGHMRRPPTFSSSRPGDTHSGRSLSNHQSRRMSSDGRRGNGYRCRQTSAYSFASP